MSTRLPGASPLQGGPTRGNLWGALHRARSTLPWVVLAAAILVLAGLSLRDRDDGGFLDPRSRAPLGTRALVEVLEGVGAEVRLTAGLPDADADTALLLLDDLDSEGRDDLREWVAEGHVLVVADTFSPLAPEQVGPTSLGFVSPSLARGCDLRALADVSRVTAPGGSVFATEDARDSCFPRNDGAFLVTNDEGRGTVVVLGGQLWLSNAELDEADNVLLAAALLAPSGSEVVAVLQPPPPGGGAATLGELIPRPVRFAVLQLLIAFVVFAVWRARRLGRPVTEPALVQVPGSELVVAVGNLLQTTAARRHAAGLLRADARAELTGRLGLPGAAPLEQIADAAAARTSASRAQVLGVLGDHVEISDDAALVHLGQAVEGLRHALTGAPPPSPGAAVVQ